MPDEERIRRRAHEIWEREGRPEGRHEDHWAQACQEVASEGDGAREAAASPGLNDDAPASPQMPVSGVLGGQVGGEGAASLSGGVGTTLREGSGAAGGRAGGASVLRPGTGASMEESPPRLGPAPVPPDDAGPGLAATGSPHGRSPAGRGKGRNKRGGA